MRLAFRTSVAALIGTLLCGCDRLDPLAVIDSPNGKAVILDILAVRSGDRVICVRSNVTELCSRSTAEVIVSDAGTDADVESDGSTIVTLP
jgi:hypothetical protein